MSNIDLNDGGQFTGQSGGVNEASELGSLEGLSADEQDIILAAEGMERKGKSGPLILVGVVVVAAGALFSMHTLTKVNASQGRNRDVEQIVNSFLNTKGEAVMGDTTAEDLLTQLTEVPPAERPFNRDLFVEGKGPAAIAGPTTEDRWLADCERIAAGFRVSSVMRDRLANINRKIVQLGGTFNENGVEFKVTEITNETVSVEAEHVDEGWRFEYQIKLRRGF